LNIFELVIVQPIFNLLMGLYAVVPGGDFGVAVILFTVIVRFLLYPLTKRALHQSKTMRKLQPELAAIKKRAKGNRQQISLESMELYKKHGVNPFRQIGILLLQLPIFIALYYSIRIFTTSRDRIGDFTYDFLEGLRPVAELIAHPDKFNEMFLHVVDLTKSAFSGGHVSVFLVLLAIVAALSQYYMSKQTMPHAQNKRRIRDIMADAAEGKQANQDEMNAVIMQRMSKVLPFFMFFIMVSLPGAIALYYAVSNLVAVAQQAYLLRKDEDELTQIATASPAASAPAKPAKRTTAAKPKPAPKEATVVRITAKDTGRRK
jgi:YidC/Oxa1 family membrane protein insertase